MKILLREEEQALVPDMNEYRFPEQEGRLVNMARFGPSCKAGWQEWRKRSKQREESSFGVFLNAMNADTETL